MRKLFLLLVPAIFFLASCDDDEVTVTSKDFTVTVENVFTSHTNFNTGTTGLITPGTGESFSFNAGKGHFLQFATMFVQSNDLFYAPSASGIELYDANGNALTGDITSMISLWDAGTEVNEMPGTGANQAPRQAAANTGTTENGTVKLIADVADGFTYPSVSDVIQVMLTHDGGTMFTVTINNVSNGASLATPLAPGAWVIHSSGDEPLFSANAAASTGLERIAEDGDNSITSAALTAVSGLVSPFAPGAYAIGANNEIFTLGQSASAAIEALAEDGNPAGYTNIFNTPVGASAAGPIMPTGSYSFTFNAQEGENLSFATMLVQSNDWFIGLDNMALFTNGVALSGDITAQLKVYDSGTEVDEYAGAGINQAPRQSGANTGTAENGVVAEETSLSGNVPTISNMVRVTISVNN